MPSPTYLELIPSRIQGIPCIIGLTDFTRVKGSFSHNAPSDLDFHGYTEMDYEILDRKEYRAKWLTAKITPEDTDRIEQDIIDYMQ